MVGLPGVKANIAQLVNYLRVQQMRRTKGLAVPDQSLHMVFAGNPGTGKTTIARLVARIYKEIGILSNGQLIESDRSGLVGGYLGQTALRVQEVVRSAIGGVLFIDEAYALTPADARDTFGDEAISTLIKLMEDHRNDIVVIVAGYTEPMQRFISSNPGLASRFSRTLNFEDYLPGELTEIYVRLASQHDYRLTGEAVSSVAELFRELYEKRDATFGNARLARNLFEKTVNNHANRIGASVGDELNADTLTTILVEDIPV